MTEGKKYRRVTPAERGFEILDMIKEDEKTFVLVKVPLENINRLAVLKTDEERRIYQKEIQRKYRERLKSKNQ